MDERKKARAHDYRLLIMARNVGTLMPLVKPRRSWPPRSCQARPRTGPVLPETERYFRVELGSMHNRLPTAAVVAMAEERILVVDDEMMVREAVRLTLSHYGFQVETASSAAEALEKLAQTTVSLVVTDLKMPETSGEELAREIRRRDPLMPIILLTGYPPQLEPVDVDAVILKPFSTADLRTTVVSLIREAAAKRSASGAE